MKSTVVAIVAGASLAWMLGIPPAFCAGSANAAAPDRVQAEHSDPFAASTAAFANEDSAQFGSDEGFAGKKKSHKPHKPHKPKHPKHHHHLP